MFALPRRGFGLETFGYGYFIVDMLQADVTFMLG